jgi:hypothetical protein
MGLATRLLAMPTCHVVAQRRRKPLAKAGGASFPNLAADLSSKLAPTFKVKSIDRKK